MPRTATLARIGAEPLTEVDRLQAVASATHLDADAGPRLDRLARLTARLMQTSMGFVSFVSEDAQLFVGMHAPDSAMPRQIDDRKTFCRDVVDTGKPLLIADSRTGWDGYAGVGDEGVIAYAGVPLVDSSGDCLGAVCVVDDKPRSWSDDELRDLEDAASTVAGELELRKLGRHLQEQARRDPLTGLLNRRGWEQALASAPAGVAVALFDLDHFKQINDAGGHAAGDVVLRRLAARWVLAVRGGDAIARLGGDEFGVLLHDADGYAAQIAAERLRAQVPKGVTVSAGVAVRQFGETLESAVKRADDSLYRAKAAGRNQLVIST